MLIWNNIKFINKEKICFEEDILSGRLICVPAAPALVENVRNIAYYRALSESSFCILDSVLFTLLARIRGKVAFKYSGYRLMKDTLYYLSTHTTKVLLVDVSETSSLYNREYFLKNTLLTDCELDSYVSPFYSNNEELLDTNLLNKIQVFKPRLIIINLAGGKQEIIGHFLTTSLSYPTTILCTGAALAFFTGKQVKISDWVDKIGLGWFARVLSNPQQYCKRYITAFKLIPLFFCYPLEEWREKK